MSYCSGQTSVNEWKSGSGTATGTPAKLSAVGIKVLRHVVIKAHVDNDGDVLIAHDSKSAAAGYALSGGETSAPIPIDDLSKIWVVASATTQDFSWFAV